MNGKPPPPEGDTTEDEPAKVKVEPLNYTEKATQEAQGAETKVNVDVTSFNAGLIACLKRKQMIHCNHISPTA